jgi:hypothetical protein
MANYKNWQERKFKAEGFALVHGHYVECPQGCTISSEPIANARWPSYWELCLRSRKSGKLERVATLPYGWLPDEHNFKPSQEQMRQTAERMLELIKEQPLWWGKPSEQFLANYYGIAQ